MLAPKVAYLLRHPGRGGEGAQPLVAFLDTLKGIAQESGWAGVWRGNSARTWFGYDDAWAVSLSGGQSPCVVVALRSWSHTTPGGEAQELFCLAESGGLNDWLVVDINSRVTHESLGELFTEVSPLPELDGASLVVRIGRGAVAWGNFDHGISHRDQHKRFYWRRVG